MELYAFMTRYVFSCLTDADFIDTETFCDMQAERGMTGDFEEALRRLDAHMSGFKADTKVRTARRELQQQRFICRSAEYAHRQRKNAVQS